MKALKQRSGFTLVELIIAITVIGVMVIPIITFITSSYLDSVRTNLAVNLELDALKARRMFSEDLKLGSNIKSSSNISDPSNASGWTTASTSQTLVFEQVAVNSSGTPIMNGTTPYKNEFIYFVSGTNLYMRVLKNAAATGNTASTTYPESYSVSTAPRDRLLAGNVKLFSFVLYDAAGAVTSTIADARAAQISLNLERVYNGSPVTANDTYRITLRNSS